LNTRIYPAQKPEALTKYDSSGAEP